MLLLLPYILIIENILFIVVIIYFFYKIRFYKKNDNQTGLLNRQSFLRDLHNIKVEFFVVLADIDNFKMLNSVYSYSLGDQVILNAKNAIVKNVSAFNAHVYRYRNGDEFVIVFDKKDISRRQLTSILNRINTEFSSFNPLQEVSFSFGVAFKNVDSTVTQLVENLEKALKIAKFAKNAIYFYCDDAEGY